MGAEAIDTRKAHDDTQLVDWLAESQVFRGLGRADLARFAEGSRLRSYNSLDEAIVEGQVSDSLNIVVSGRFIVLLPSHRLDRYGDNAMVSLDSYVAGQSFGEAALAGESHSFASASIVATEPSQVVAIPRATFQRVVAEDNRIGRVVYRNLFEIEAHRLGALVG